MRTALAALTLLLAAGAAFAGTVADASGRRLSLPPRVTRVYAAGPPASILVFAVAPDKLVGWTRALRPEEAAFLPPRYASLPVVGRLTGRGGTANLEVVLASKPDLIVDSGSTAPTYVSLAERVQAQTGIPYALLDGHLGAVPTALRTLGRMLGDEARADRLAAYFERELNDIRRRVASVPQASRPTVYYGRGPDGLQTGGSRSINVEALKFLGARNVAAEVPAGLVTVPIEQVLLWDPQVILTSDAEFWRNVRRDPRWQAVTAVSAHRVYLSPHLPFGWFDFPPGANRLIGLWWAGSKLYPEAFRVDLRAKVREFFGLFYHRVPSEAQIDALLGESGAPPR